MIDQDVITAEERELIEFLESFEGDIKIDDARTFFELVEDVDTDLHSYVNETLTEIIDIDLVIEAQKQRNGTFRKQLLAIELDIPMITVVRETVKSKLYDLRIYDEE